MEQFAKQLVDHLSPFADVTPIVNRRGKRALPIFLPTALAQSARLARSGRFDAIHLSDALLSPVGALLKRATGLPVSVSVHGLDLTYRHPLYQRVVPASLRSLDLVIANSSATAEILRDRVQPSPRHTVASLGVNPLPPVTDDAADAFRRGLGLEAGRPLLLTAGRLIRRKGVAWFVEHVLPVIGCDASYIVVGEGPDRLAIERAAAAAGVAQRVRLPGRLSDSELSAAYRIADVFVMPNVVVPGDVEGFGLVALEASAAGLPVVAADIEGIRDAIQHEENGLLARSADPVAFASTIGRLLAMAPAERRALGAAQAAVTRSRFDWSLTARHYAEEISRLVEPRRLMRAA
jgi:glycosyltransferase involved in cell wall biosynthesis